MTHPSQRRRRQRLIAAEAVDAEQTEVDVEEEEELEDLLEGVDDYVALSSRPSVYASRAISALVMESIQSANQCPKSCKSQVSHRMQRNHASLLMNFERDRPSLSAQVIPTILKPCPSFLKSVL